MKTENWRGNIPLFDYQGQETNLYIPNMDIRISSIYPFGKETEEILDVYCAAMAVEKEMLLLPHEHMVSINCSGEFALNYYIATEGHVSFVDLNAAFYNMLQAALLSNADSIMVLHNHPTGTKEPSQEDLDGLSIFTNICALLGIEVIDMRILGIDGVCQCREKYPQYLRVRKDVWERLVPPPIKKHR